jgi:hypothetical protein
LFYGTNLPRLHGLKAYAIVLCEFLEHRQFLLRRSLDKLHVRLSQLTDPLPRLNAVLLQNGLEWGNCAPQFFSPFGLLAVGAHAIGELLLAFLNVLGDVRIKFPECVPIVLLPR